MPKNIEPVALRIPEAQQYSGLSRSELYRMAGAGKLKILKSGRSSLIEFQSLRRAVLRLPTATIRTKK